MIIFLLPSFSGGGAERVTLNLIIGLKDRGYSVGIIVFNKDGPLLSMVPVDVPIYNLRKSTLRRCIIPLIQKIQELQPKVIFSTLGYVNVVLLVFRWFLPKQLRIWVREANLPSISLSNNPHPRLMTFLYNNFYRKADKIICTSTRMRNEFISDFSISKEIIQILQNPIDIDQIRRSALPKNRFDKGGVCYISAGRLTFQKGFDRLLYWFSELEDKKSTLVILGDGELKFELLRKAESLGIQDRFKLLGFCNNPWQWIAGADIFLSSSYWEGMPNAALEALACGVSVIATSDSGGIREVNQKANPGAIIVVEDSVGFIKAMTEVEIQKHSKLRHSLLPSAYHLKSVIQKIELLFDEQ
jgi:glycosyltransferase involved in cell wall biosynthesis